MPGLSIDNYTHSWSLSPVPRSKVHNWGPDSIDWGRSGMNLHAKRRSRQSIFIYGIGFHVLSSRIPFVDKLRDETVNRVYQCVDSSMESIHPWVACISFLRHCSIREQIHVLPHLQFKRAKPTAIEINDLSSVAHYIYDSINPIS